MLSFCAETKGGVAESTRISCEFCIDSGFDTGIKNGGNLQRIGELGMLFMFLMVFLRHGEF